MDATEAQIFLDAFRSIASSIDEQSKRLAEQNALLGALLTRLNDTQTDHASATNRLADAVTIIARHVDPEAAKKLDAPSYQRPLKAYATFDWSSINADVIAFDRHGATEVEHNGNTYTRRRSTEDDPKGEAIRFSRVSSGTLEQKNLQWVNLIRFADKKKAEVKPLRGEIAEKIEQAASASATRISPPAQQAAKPAALPPAQKAAPPDEPVAESSATSTPDTSSTQTSAQTDEPKLAIVSTVNRTAVQTISKNFATGYYKGKAGAQRLPHAIHAVKDQIAMRGYVEPEITSAIKAKMKTKDASEFLKLAIDFLIEHDAKAPHEDPPF